LATRPGKWGAGDLAYALDELTEEALRAFGDDLAGRHPLVLIDEDAGTRVFDSDGRGQPLRVLVDPVDGTRSLMHDMRSAWAVTCVAPDRGELTRLSDAVLAVQTELPTTSAGTYRVMWAVRGQGAHIATHAVGSGAELDRRPLVVDDDPAIENGYLCFTRYLPIERTMVAEIERLCLERAIEAEHLNPRLLYDDQYLASAGQLFLTATGRYRMLADLRGWLGRLADIDNFTAKPYDLAALLVYTEAGVPVLGDDLLPLNAPLDTSTPLSVIAFANTAVQDRMLPHLKAAMEAVQGG
jgi:fructose-1,6-bisphosphatase/inositol monophosphatase family enzyme